MALAMLIHIMTQQGEPKAGTLVMVIPPWPPCGEEMRAGEGGASPMGPPALLWVSSWSPIWYMDPHMGLCAPPVGPCLVCVSCVEYRVGLSVWPGDILIRQ